MPMICHGVDCRWVPLGPMSGFLSAMDPSIHSASSCVCVCVLVEKERFSFGLWDPSSAHTFFPAVYSCCHFINLSLVLFRRLQLPGILWGEGSVSPFLLDPQSRGGRKCISGTHSPTPDYIRICGRIWQESPHLTTFFFCSFSLGKILKAFCFHWKLLLIFFPVSHLFCSLQWKKKLNDLN